MKYKLKENSHVTHQFMLSIVVPGIARKYTQDANNQLASVLELPLLWAAHEPRLEHMMSNLVREWINTGYSVIHGGDMSSEPLDLYLAESTLCCALCYL